MYLPYSIIWIVTRFFLYNCFICRILISTSIEYITTLDNFIFRIYIGNIVEKVNVGKLNGAFEEFGNIVDISINKEGYAYIEFEREEEAARAVEETNGTEIFGGFLEVEITSYKGNDLPPSKKKDKLLESKLETRSESRPARQPESGPSSSRFIAFLI